MHATRRRLLTAAAVLSTGIAAIGPAALAQAGEEAAVAKAVEELRTAMLAADKSKLLALAADGLSYGHSSGKLETKAEYAEPIAAKTTVYKTLTFTDQKISVVGNNAIVRNTFTSDVESGGKPQSVTIGVLQVWQKEAGGWKMLARQAFKL